MQLAPMGTTIVATEDGLRVPEKGLVGEVHRLVQADSDALRTLRRAEQTLLSRLRSVLDGPGAIGVSRLHQVAHLAHRRRSLGQWQRVFHLDERKGSCRGIDAPAPVDCIRLEVTLDRAGQGLWRL